jgi:hypothetical protein
MQPGLTLTERHYLTMPLLTNPLAKPLVKLYLSDCDDLLCCSQSKNDVLGLNKIDLYLYLIGT